MFRGTIFIGPPCTLLKRHKCMEALHRVSGKKTLTHIIGYKLKNNCLISVIFDTKIPHII